MKIETTFLSLKFQINLKRGLRLFWVGAELDEKGIQLNSRDYFTTIKTLNICKLCFEFDYHNGL